MLTNVVRTLDLDTPWVLAPERYDPRRSAAEEFAVRIADVARIVRDTISPPGVPGEAYLVLDTGDARVGVISTERDPGPGEQVLGSTKKRVRAGDVIISRLRPYLRQVGYVDKAIAQGGSEIAVSTEFLVLRSNDDESIAFLVPLLLSARVQTALAAAQEGGHHPRFSESTLGRIGIPEATLVRRDELSRTIEEAVTHIRRGEGELRVATSSVTADTRA
jgi:hypothetical protein